jgi:hypothetical protein
LREEGGGRCGVACVPGAVAQSGHRAGLVPKVAVSAGQFQGLLVVPFRAGEVSLAAAQGPALDEHLCFRAAYPEVAGEAEGALERAGRAGQVAGHAQYGGEAAEGVGLARTAVQVEEDGSGLPDGRFRGWDRARAPPHAGEVVEGVALAPSVASLAEDGQRVLECPGCGRVVSGLAQGHPEDVQGVAPAATAQIAVGVQAQPQDLDRAGAVAGHVPHDPEGPQCLPLAQRAAEFLIGAQRAGKDRDGGAVVAEHPVQDAEAVAGVGLGEAAPEIAVDVPGLL